MSAEKKSSKYGSSEERPLLSKRPPSLAAVRTFNDPPFALHEDRDGIEKKTKKHHLPVWAVGDYDVLPDMPLFYIADVTSVVILDETPKVIASRIVACLTSMSAVGNFYSQQANALVHTIDQAELMIQMFKDPTSKKRGGILVEVQRRNSNSFNFHQAAQAILSAAKGTKTRRRNYIRAPPLVDSKPRHDSKLFSTADIENASVLLSKDRMDAQLLGMESLLLLTDDHSSSGSTTLYASRAVLKNEKNILDKILDLVWNQEKDAEETLSIDSNHDMKMRNCALSVLANTLSIVSKQREEFKSLVETQEWDGTNGVLSKLVSELKHVDSRPHDAYQAARCVNTLVEVSQQMRQRAIEFGAPALALECQSGGHCRHGLLGSISDRIVDILGEVKEVSSV